MATLVIANDVQNSLSFFLTSELVRVVGVLGLGLGLGLVT